MVNRVRGEVLATINGKQYTLLLTLGAVADLEDATGASLVELAGRMSDGGRVKDIMATLAAMSAAGGNPISLEEMRGWSFDVIREISVEVSRALSAQFGDGPGNVVAGANPATSQHPGANGSGSALAS